MSLAFLAVSWSSSLRRSLTGFNCRFTHFLRAKGFMCPQNPSFDCVDNGCPVAYVLLSFGFIPVDVPLADAPVCTCALGEGEEVGDCVDCANAGIPRLAASISVATIRRSGFILVIFLIIVLYSFATAR